MRRIHYQTEFIGLARVEDRERRARNELRLYEEIKYNFAYYIGSKIFGKLNFTFKIPKEVCIEVGNLVLDNQ